MKNTNKNMMYTFWSGAILLCLALVAVVLVVYQRRRQHGLDEGRSHTGRDRNADADAAGKSDRAHPVVRCARADGG